MKSQPAARAGPAGRLDQKQQPAARRRERRRGGPPGRGRPGKSRRRRAPARRPRRSSSRRCRKGLPRFCYSCRYICRYILAELHRNPQVYNSNVLGRLIEFSGSSENTYTFTNLLAFSANLPNNSSKRSSQSSSVCEPEFNAIKGNISMEHAYR